jgi:5-methylcytosine-specific restriction endonuclease McrA
MYLPNKYTTWYNNIIQRAKSRLLNGYKERHHIIPKSLGGSDLKENLLDSNS